MEGYTLLRILTQAFAVTVASAASLDVIGGSTTHIDAAKFMVQIFTNLTTDPNDKVAGHHWASYCGGTLVSQFNVLTSGHCVNAETNTSPGYKDTLTAVVGSSDFLARGTNGRMVVVKSFARHPKFRYTAPGDAQSPVYDVAVLRLKEAVPASAKTGFIGLAKVNQLPKAGSVVTAAGWGVYTEDQKSDWSRKLRTATFSILADTVCKAQWGTTTYFPGLEFCVAESPKIATCSGDSGGPAYIGNVQYGIVSWGRCGTTKENSGVYASLANAELNAFVVEKMRTLT